MKIATPISNLFNSNLDAERIISLSDCLECRDHSLDSIFPNQEVFHCDIQLIQGWGQKELDYLRLIKKNKPDLKLISFHMASCFDAPALINKRFIPGGKKLSIQEMKNHSIVNTSDAHRIFGNNIFIALENNNDLKTEAYDYVTDPDFISEIVVTNDIRFLYDIAHAKISSFNQNTTFENYAKKLPLHKLSQVHISKPGFTPENEIVDAHELPGQEEIQEVILLLEKYKIEYLTIEYYKDTANLLQLLSSVKQIMR